MADSLTFDFDAVTPRMMVEFKKKTGTSLMSLANAKGEMDLAKVSEEVIAGVVWLALRMSGHPDATYDEALDTPLSRLDLSGEGEAPDPTPASKTSKSTS